MEAEVDFNVLPLLLLYLLGLAIVLKRLRYFRLPNEENRTVRLNWQEAIGGIATVLVAVFVFGPSLASIVLTWAYDSDVVGLLQNPEALGWYRLIVSGSVLFFLAVHFLTLPRQSSALIWRGDRPMTAFRAIRDFFIGAGTWLVCLPVVGLLGQICLWLMEMTWGKTEVEQVAVEQLKEAIKNPQLFVTTSVAIVVAAPLYEEFLFRGYIQTALRQRLGRFLSILLTSLCFAAAHFAWEQGAGNIPLLLSLFLLSLFLGFIYERQQSIVAPIGLHAVFNLISTVSVLLMS